MIKYIYPIAVLVTIISCKQNQDTKLEEKKSSKKVESEIVIQEEQYIENDSILDKMNSKLYEFVKNPKFKVEKETFKNRYVDGVIDTVKTYTFDNTSIIFYKTASEEWIYDAKIANSEFELIALLKIGIERKLFEKIIQTKTNSNLVKIGNLEQTSVFVFKFKDDILQEIIYEGYID